MSELYISPSPSPSPPISNSTSPSNESNNDSNDSNSSLSETTIINPYNFNNNLISRKDITKLLSKYDIHLEPNNLDLYQNAFIHKSYTKKNPDHFQNDVKICKMYLNCI